MEISPEAQSIIKESKEWTLAGDFSILQWMQEISKNLELRVNNTSNLLETLDTDVERTCTALNNANHSLTALQYSQFVESRIYEDNESLPTTVKSSLEYNENTEKQQVSGEERLNKFLKKNLDMMRNCHERYCLDYDSDNEGPSNDYVYQPKNPYNDRPLPHVYGSQLWKDNWHVGICDCNDDYVPDNVSEQLSELSTNDSFDSKAANISEWKSSAWLLDGHNAEHSDFNTSTSYADRNSLEKEEALKTKIYKSMSNIKTIKQKNSSMLSKNTTISSSKGSLSASSISSSTQHGTIYSENTRARSKSVSSEISGDEIGKVDENSNLESNENVLTHSTDRKEDNTNVRAKTVNLFDDDEYSSFMEQIVTKAAKKPLSSKDNPHVATNVRTGSNKFLKNKSKSDTKPIDIVNKTAMPKFNNLFESPTNSLTEEPNIFVERSQSTFDRQSQEHLKADSSDKNLTKSVNLFESPSSSPTFESHTSSSTEEPKKYVEIIQSNVGRQSQEHFKVNSPDKNLTKSVNLFESPSSSPTFKSPTSRLTEEPKVFVDRPKSEFIRQNQDNLKADSLEKNLKNTVNIFESPRSSPTNDLFAFSESKYDHNEKKSPNFERNQEKSEKLEPVFKSGQYLPKVRAVNLFENSEDELFEEKPLPRIESIVVENIAKKTPSTSDDDLFSAKFSNRHEGASTFTKTTAKSLFDDNDDDDDFLDIFGKNSSSKSTLNFDEVLKDKINEDKNENYKCEEKLSSPQKEEGKVNEVKQISERQSTVEDIFPKYSNIFLDEPPEDDDFIHTLENKSKSTDVTNSNNLYDSIEELQSNKNTSKVNVNYSGLSLFMDVPPDDDIPSPETKRVHSIFYDDFNETIEAKPNFIDRLVPTATTSNYFLSDEPPADLEIENSEVLHKTKLTNKSIHSTISKIQVPNIEINVKALLPSGPHKILNKPNVKPTVSKSLLEDEVDLTNNFLVDHPRQENATETDHVKTSILPNLCKNRVSVPFKRRPSTRKARFENYLKSTVSKQKADKIKDDSLTVPERNMFHGEKVRVDSITEPKSNTTNTVQLIEPVSTTATSSKLSNNEASLFLDDDEMKPSDDLDIFKALQSNTHKEKPLSNKASIGVNQILNKKNNEISLFSNDEKIPNKSAVKLKSSDTVTLSFEKNNSKDVFSAKDLIPEKKLLQNSSNLFLSDNSSSDDDFSTLFRKSKSINKKAAKTPSSKTNKKSLFSDSENDDDSSLFVSTTKHSTAKTSSTSQIMKKSLESQSQTTMEDNPLADLLGSS